jgi:hypothetical protein
VGRQLGWLVVQVWVLVPVVLGQTSIQELPHDPVGVWVLEASLAVVISFFVIRSLVRLWRVPAGEASGSAVTALAILGTLYLLFSSGPLLASERWSTKPMGVAHLLVGGCLSVLAAREALRVRSRRRPIDAATILR